MNSVVNYQKKDLPAKVGKLGYGLLAAGILLFALAYAVDGARAAFNNVVLYTFLVSIGLGSLILVAVEYVAGAVWSVPFRRIPEAMGSILYILPVAVVPLLFKLHDLYHWTHKEAVAADHLLHGKAPYLNEPFFIGRSFFAVVIWAVFYFIIVKNSNKQDASGDQNLTTRNIRISAVLIPIIAITLTYTAIDWLMSLEPHWFSTIFGGYYFTGSLLAAIALCTIIIVLLNENGYFVKGLLPDHYYSLGAFLFAFTNFWAYIAFSQFVLIWYANLPEETFWLMMRWEGSWKYFTIFFVLIHFAIPYFGLLSRPSKQNPKRLIYMSSLILFAHYVDLFWMSMPTFNKEGFVFGWMELAAPVLIAGVVITFLNIYLKKRNFVPIGDPKLKRGMEFRL